METVAGVVLLRELAGAAWIPDELVKVDRGIEGSVAKDPVVDPLSCGVPAAAAVGAAEGGDGGAEDFVSFGLGVAGDLLVSRNKLVANALLSARVRAAIANVVDT